LNLSSRQVEQGAIYDVGNTKSEKLKKLFVNRDSFTHIAHRLSSRANFIFIFKQFLSTADEEMAAILRSYLRQLEDAYCKAVTRAQAVGELNLSVDARELARMLLCTTQGMALVGRVLDDELLLQSVVKSTMALLKKT